MADDAPDQILPDAGVGADAGSSSFPASTTPAPVPPAERQPFAIALGHGLSLGRDAAGNVTIEKRAWGPEDVRPVPVDNRVVPEAPVLFVQSILPDEFAHVVAQLGDLGPSTKEPGADKTFRPVAAE